MTTLFRKLYQRRKNKGAQMQDSINIKATALSHVGNIRKVNEDSIGFTEYNNASHQKLNVSVGVICDGMGGHNSGEVASNIAKEAILKSFENQHGQILKNINNALESANAEVFKASIDKPDLKGMGTTATLVAIVNQKIFVGHVGDSRAYYINKDGVLQMTKDHTYVEYLIDSGLVFENERDSHPKRNVLTQALGTKAQLKYDSFQYEMPMNVGDKILLCSDGLHEYLKPIEIREIIKGDDNLSIAERMIELALERGGHDNISVLIMECQRENQKSNLITKQIR